MDFRTLEQRVKPKLFVYCMNMYKADILKKISECPRGGNLRIEKECHIPLEEWADANNIPVFPYREDFFVAASYEQLYLHVKDI